MHDKESVRYEIDRAYRVLLGITLTFVGTDRWANPAKQFYFRLIFVPFLAEKPVFHGLRNRFSEN